MNGTLVKCPSCGSTNRLPPLGRGRKALCGRCKAPLTPAEAATAAATGPMTVTDSTFAAEVERSPLPVLLDLWADWCGPCHVLAPTIDQLSMELAGRVKVAKLNIDENRMTADRYGVQSIPTVLLLNGGKEMDRIVGVQPKQEIMKRVQRLIG